MRRTLDASTSFRGDSPYTAFAYAIDDGHRRKTSKERSNAMKLRASILIPITLPLLVACTSSAVSDQPRGVITCGLDSEGSDFGDCCDNFANACTPDACSACLDTGGTWQPEANECTTDCALQDISCFVDSCPNP